MRLSIDCLILLGSFPVLPSYQKAVLCDSDILGELVGIGFTGRILQWEIYLCRKRTVLLAAYWGVIAHQVFSLREKHAACLVLIILSVVVKHSVQIH